MGRRRLLLLLKPVDVYPFGRSSSSLSRVTTPKITSFLENRHEVHKAAINFCQDVLKNKGVDCQTVLRANLSKPIRNFDLVVTIGGDGTLLQSSHFMDDSIPVLGVNSDPTIAEEVEEYANDFDASRSTGYLCAANVNNFEQVLDDILHDKRSASRMARISLTVNSVPVPTYALNDVLISHPCPATVSRFSFRISKDDELHAPIANCRSSGLRLSTGAGSTAAMLSAGGFAMPILSQDLQYMVREPISPRPAISSLMHGIIKSDQSMDVSWFSEKGVIYIDGSHVRHDIQDGDVIRLSSKAPVLRVFLPCRTLS